MIAMLRGEVARIDANVIVLDVAGVGYRVSVPVSTLLTIGGVGETVMLHVHTIVREDELSLYGFGEHAQLRAFELLIGVSGIGPKVALAILSSLDAGALAQAVASADTRSLSRVPGIGIKTAQRLVLDLKEKMAVLAYETRADQKSPTPARVPEDAILADVVDGLANLGYTRPEARRAAERAMENASDRTDVAGLLRASLNLLTK